MEQIVNEPIISQEWCGGLATYLEQDSDFRVHARWLTARIAFRCDRHVVTMAFERGIVLDVKEGLSQYEYLISGSQEDWDLIYQHNWSLIRLFRAKRFEIRGQTKAIMQDWKALFFIF